MYSFFTFSYTTNFEFFFVFCIFLGRFLTLCMKTYYTACIVYDLSFLGKSFKSFMPNRLFLSGANKKPFKSKNSIGRKCSQLKVLKVLLMHLFVTLLINKITDTDNRKQLSQDPQFKVHLNKS